MADPIIRLFEEILISAEAIEEWVAQGNGETSILEYKLDPAVEKRHDPEGGKLPAKYSKEATAFANADGGIIVWGVDQKQGRPPIAVPLVDAKHFHSEQIRSETDLASPPIAGLRHQIMSKVDGSGYVVSFIPRSSIGPHMAMARHNKYYVRAGESAVPMGHHQVKDAMLAMRTPKLILDCTKKMHKVPGGAMDSLKHFGFRIRNIGSISAINPSISVRSHFHDLNIFTTERNDGPANDYSFNTLVNISFSRRYIHPYSSVQDILIGPRTGTSFLDGEYVIDIGLFAENFAQFYRIQGSVASTSNMGPILIDSYEPLSPTEEYHEEIIRGFSLRHFRE